MQSVRSLRDLDVEGSKRERAVIQFLAPNLYALDPAIPGKVVRAVLVGMPTTVHGYIEMPLSDAVIRAALYLVNDDYSMTLVAQDERDVVK